MSKKKSLPAMPFYIGDWKKDPAVQAMTAEDEGIYLRLLMICWESERRGYLQLNNKPIDNEILSSMIKLDNQRLTTWLTKYQNIFHVFSEMNGILYSRKQLEILELQEKRHNSGKKGGNPILISKNRLTNSKPHSLANCENETEDEIEDLNTLKKYKEFEVNVLNWWNHLCKERPIFKPIRAISESRRKHLKERFKQNEFKDFTKILNCAIKQQFLMGDNDRKWVMDFDFLIKNDTNYLKVLEMKYAKSNV